MKKILVILYGIISYVTFLIAFLYAIGFVGNLLVPKTIDSGAEPPFMEALMINIALMSLFAIQHSVMARPAFKKWVTQLISPATERSTYVLLSSLALILLYWQWQPMNTVIWAVEGVPAIMLTGLFYGGWLIIFLSSFMISHFELFGLTQVFYNFKDKTAPTPEFQVNFFYKIVRHPIMVGFIIAFWATPTMTVGHLLFTVVTTLYIIIAVKYLEEKDLKKAIGEDYLKYQKRVPMFVPFSKSKQKGLESETSL
jgi:protein-S-isoprenylcysteine O-methyltransferase Ste14